MIVISREKAESTDVNISYITLWMYYNLPNAIASGLHHVFELTGVARLFFLRA
jgi:hypothetical protein